ncbi:hypothetical protein EMN47_01995 [Prolixibacteraceae bacterium JC049]|nr:hypothetical protein [Prolixibacteraceae bacterium JC049]
MILDNNQSYNSEKFWSFYPIVWVLFSVSMLLVSRFPELKSSLLKVLVPLVFLLIVFKQNSIQIRNKGLKAYILLFAWGALSLLYTVNIDKTVDYLGKMLGILFVWYITSRLISRIGNLKFIFFPLLAAFLVNLYFGLSTPVYAVGNGIARASGILGNANALGIFLWYGIVVCMIFIEMFKHKQLEKVFFYALMILFAYGILHTGSRKSAFVVLLFFATYIFLQSRKNFSIIFIAFIIVYLGYTYFFDYIINNTAFGLRVESNVLEHGAEKRLGLILEGFDMFFKNPLLGVGLGSFTSYSASGLMAHNEHVEILASMGLIGLIIYWCVYYDIINRLWKIRMYHDKVLYIYMAFIVGYIFLSLGTVPFLNPLTIMMLVVFYELINRKYFYYKNGKII